MILSYNVTIDDTSPIIRYTPDAPTNDTSNGWEVVCAAQTPWRCDEHSAHTTNMDGAKFAFSFWGTSLALYGNVTLGMNYTLTIDGNSQPVSNPGGSDGQTLLSVDNLSAAQHTVGLTTIRGSPQSTLTFDRAVVGLGKATSVNKTYVDGNNSRAITFGPSGQNLWGVYNNYVGTIVPPGVNNVSFQGANVKGASFYYKFSGSAFFYYGPCYLDTHSYTVELDGSANSQPQLYNASVPWGQQLIEGCLHYHAAGLSKGTQHEILVTNAEDHWLTLNWLEVWDYDLVDQGGGGSSSPSPSSAPVGAISASSPMLLLWFLCLVYLRLL